MNGDGTGRAFDVSEAGQAPSVISQLLDGSYPGHAQPQAPSDAAARSLPRPGDPYRAYGREAGQMLPTLFLLLADGTRRGFPYAGLVGGPDLVEASSGLVIILRFSDVVPMEVTLSGRNLEELYEALGYHEVAWVRALPPGKMISDRALPVVSSIAVKPLLPAEG
jgi:hypothetical protein